MSWLTGPSKPNPIVTGYRYHLGMHMLVGHGNMDGLEKIKVGEKVVWTESNVIRDSNTIVLTSLPVYPQGWVAQTFTASSSYTLSSITLMMWKPTYYHPGIVTVSIRATDIDGHPTGEDLCMGTTDGETLPNVFALANAEWREIEFTAPIILTSGTKYAIVVRTTESEINDGVNWNASGDIYTGGRNENSADCGKTWIAPTSSFDFCFKCNQKSGTAPNCTVTVNAPTIFGGNKEEGGISGNVDLMFGDPEQDQNSYLVNNLDSDIPAFRGLMGFVLNRTYIGTSPYLKPWSFFCKRVCKQISGEDQWYREKAVIRPREESGDDLNVAHIIRECLIDPEWGRGFPVDDIDDNSFKEAANILYNENFGLSILWDQIQLIEEFIDDALRCIAGFLYQDLETGKWILTLTRDPDYDNPYDYNNVGDNNQGSRNNSGLNDKYQFAQTFTTSRNFTCNKTKIKIYKAGSITVRVELQETDADGHPNGNVLTHGTIPNSNISTSAEWVECDFIKNYNLMVNTKYALVVYPINSGILYWRVNTFSSFEGGHYESSADYGSTWTIVYTNDFMFEIYAGAELETFNEDDIIDIENFTRPSYGEIINQITINWWDKLAHKSRPATVSDIALIEKEYGNLIESVQNFYGICNATLANQVAERELKLVSSMLASMRIKATRRMSHLKPNDIFKLSWNNLDIVQMIIRVLEVDYGNLENNEICLNCIEDSFSTAETIYGDPSDTLWTDPISNAIAVTNARLIEIPYWNLCNELESQSIVDAYSNIDIGFMYIVAVKPTLDAFDFDYLIQYTITDDFLFTGGGTWCPSATIKDAILKEAIDITIELENEISLDFVVEGNYAIIDNEIVKILLVDIANNQIEIARGILDTVPEFHSAGNRIYFAGSNYVPVEKEYTNGDQPKVKLLTRTAKGILDEDDANIEIADVFNSRMIRPYVPGNLKFNTKSYSIYFSTTATGKVTVTWNHRDRTDADQLQSLIKHTDSNNFGPEVGTTYTIKIYNKKNVLKRTAAGLTGTSYDYTEAMEISNCGQLQGELRFVICSIRNGYNSWQNYDIRLQRTCKGTVASSSGLSGKLNISKQLISSSSGTSNISGILNKYVPLIGSVIEISNAFAELIAYFDGRNRINSVSFTSGDISFSIALCGSSPAISGISGMINKELKLTGSSDEILNITGLLRNPTLMEYYISGMDASGAVYWDGAIVVWRAQSFTASDNYNIIEIILKLYRLSGLPGNVTVSIRVADAFGRPTGEDLCSATINANDITTNSAGEEYTFGFESPASLVSGIQYAIVLKSPVNASTYVRWFLDVSGATYPGGNYLYSTDGGVTWELDTEVDFYFKNYK